MTGTINTDGSTFCVDKNIVFNGDFMALANDEGPGIYKGIVADDIFVALVTDGLGITHDVFKIIILDNSLHQQPVIG